MLHIPFPQQANLRLVQGSVACSLVTKQKEAMCVKAMALEVALIPEVAK